MMADYESILLIGTFAEDEYCEELAKDSLYSQFAANQVQQYYLSGIEANSDAEVEVISGLVTNLFPKGRRLWIGDRHSERGRIKITNVGYPNVFPINLLTQKKKMSREARKWAQRNVGKRSLVLVYALRAPFLHAAKVVKSVAPQTTVICVVPDLPHYMHDEAGLVRKRLIALNCSLLDKERICVDGYVYYAKAMADRLERDPNRWIVIEGVYSESSSESIADGNSEERHEKNVILYAGNLSRRYGVMALVEGFLMADLNDAELWLFGDGECAEEIKEISKCEHSVKFGGLVSPAISKEQMRKASLLVNPRSNEGEYTRYSCPSKTMEYMASGTPVLMAKLDGIPDEYYEHCFLLEECTPEGIRDALEKTLSNNADYLSEVGKSARCFILSEKTGVSQAKRLLDFAMRIESI